MSSGDDALSFIYLVGVLVLVRSAVAVRRIPLGQAAKMALAWILIFAAAFVLFTLRDDFGALGKRIWREFQGVEMRQGGELRVKKSEDGHFWLDGEVNGENVRFLVESGATVTTLSPKTARAAGIERSGSSPVLVDTANGTVEAWRGRAERFAIGGIRREDFPVHLSADDIDVVGMNFLSSLSGWRVEGEWLVLVP